MLLGVIVLVLCVVMACGVLMRVAACLCLLCVVCALLCVVVCWCVLFV